MLRRLLLWSTLVLSAGLLAGPAWALTPQQARALVAGETEDRIAALNKILEGADEKTVALIQAISNDAVKFTDSAVYVMKDDKGHDPVSGAEVPVPEAAEDVVNNNQMRSELDAALASIKLFSAETSVRADAVKTLAGEPDEAKLPIIEKAYAAEQVPAIKAALAAVRAAMLLGSADPAKRLEAAKSLGATGTPATKTLLLDRQKVETDPAVKGAITASLDQIEGRLAWGERLGVIFTGISLGSILLLVALGLAITYGLMGVINMAHGELMMIGAYATYVVQNLFKAYLPGLFDYYVLLAIPASFLAAAAVGAVMERSVIRFLYGRPLETLLATWGISLVLQQAVRSLFGAQNVPVENPAWLSGGIDVMSNLTLPFNRIAIIAFALLVLLGVSALIARTRLGLFVRGVTQNRKMAACMGVNTARIDTYAFALGSGIAGLAGCALSQVGNVGPDLGQGYIVDAFMVVVLGGVGQLAGTVYAALGLGVLNKLLEGWQGAVLAKIMVLVFIVVFIQKRPQGIFAMKGRSAEA
ncbi:MAG TPA: urea ABC transporter permease subunit UrtB [Burkholderiaceae bacterium]|nr:urea ABC transporter permease subunit UrtB [Burkholderiaceae bacterium]